MPDSNPGPWTQKSGALPPGLGIRISIHFPSWIRIGIQYADPDPGGKIFKENNRKNARKLVFIVSLFKKNEVN